MLLSTRPGTGWLSQGEKRINSLITFMFNRKAKISGACPRVGYLKLQITTTSTTTTKVLVQATDSYKAKLQLEAMYGRGNVVSSPVLVR